MSHIPVMMNEVLEALQPADGQVYLDGTFGGGGYTKTILEAANCKVLGVDRDPDAIARGRNMQGDYPGLIMLEGCFGDLDQLSNEAGFKHLDGVVLDLGVSSYQLDQAERGFSFNQDGPLDMRMAKNGPSAADIVNTYAADDLADIFFHLGEERESRRVARAIVQRRTEQLFEATLDLADVVEKALGGRRGRKTHPATKVFQAIRMFINDELGELARALEAAERVLKVGGRLVIVTFHSLEDRLVKSFLTERSGQQSGGSRHMPSIASGPSPSFESVKRKTAPTNAEVGANRRARSARLRCATRTNHPAWAQPVDTGLPLPVLKEIRA